MRCMKSTWRLWILRQAGVVLAAAAMLAAPGAAIAKPDVELTDQAIADAIEDELLADPGVLSALVDVTVNDGVADLAGEVDNLLAKERAVRTAQTIKGVRAVVDRITVDPPETRTDAQLQSEIEAALAVDPATEAYEITTTVDDGTATLSGEVDSFQERRLAINVAMGVRGVSDVKDQITVNYATDRSDREIEADVVETLKWNALIDDQLIRVNVEDGDVQLSGVVGSSAEKMLAISDARVAGVESVDAANLEVERWARDEDLRGDKFVVKSADELREAVNDAFLDDPRVNMFNVDVNVANGIVTLRGTVDNLNAKRAAGRDAENTVGVVSVRNRLKVRPADPPSDLEIVADYESALARDPYLSRHEITAAVVNGTMHLYGDVDSYFERSRADLIASRQPGVVDVENHLIVDGALDYYYDPYVDDLYVEGDAIHDYEPRVPFKSDEEIARDIESQLWWSPFVDSTDVHVVVENGVAVLSGSVETAGERRAATENAYDGGATLVDNNLTIDAAGYFESYDS